MDIKIICPCGARFAFEVEPEDGRMPVAVACPSCGADATPLANDQIHAALPAAAAPPPAPVRAALRVGSVTTVASVARDTQATVDSPLPRCGKHATEVAVAECSVCSKPMCQDCVDQFGFVCSVYCRQQAENRGLVIPEHSGTRQRARQRERRRELRILAAIPVVLALLVGAGAYYFFHASRPRVAWNAQAPSGKRFAHAIWRNPGQLVALSGDRLALLDAASGRAAWSMMSKPDETLPVGIRTPPLGLTQEALWVVFGSRVVRFQLTNGQRKTEIPLPSPPDALAWSETTLALASSPSPDKEVVTWIELASGQVNSETFVVPVARSTGRAAVLDNDDRPGGLSRPFDGRVFAMPRGAARLTRRMLQPNLVPMSAPGQRGSASVLDKETLRAGDSDRAGAEFLRNTAETRHLDLSRYAASIRWLGASAAEWKGDTIGRPTLFPLATVSVLIANTNLQVFGPGGEKRWESRLAYPVDDAFLEEDTEFPDGPCREIGGRLYVADLANLTAFDLATGQVVWRVQAIGIRDLQPAPRGGLYITATTAGPQSIIYYNPKDADESVQPLLLRVDGAGQLLWQAAGFGDRVMASGKFLYVTRAQSSRLDALKAAVDGGGGDAPMHFRVHRLDPKDGRLLWESYQPRAPQATAARQNRFFLLYPDELQLVKFFSL